MADSKENHLEDLESEGLPKWKSKVGNWKNLVFSKV